MSLTQCRVAWCGCSRNVGSGTRACRPCGGTGMLGRYVCGACHGTRYELGDAPDFIPAALSPAQVDIAERCIRAAEKLWILPAGSLCASGRTYPLPSLRACVATVLAERGFAHVQIARVLSVRRSAVQEYLLALTRERLGASPDFAYTLDVLRGEAARKRSVA